LGEIIKILLYSVNFAPEPTGIGKYSGEMAEWLAHKGHMVRVVAAPPYYPAWRVDRAHRWPPYRREQWGRVAIWRAPIWVPRSPGGVTRVVHLLSFALTSLPIALWQIVWDPDVVIVVAPAFVCATAGLLTARLSGARAWLHIQDFEVDLAFRMGLLKGKALQGFIRRMERWLLRRFDRVSTISHRMLAQLHEKGVEEARTHYFPNWVDLAEAKSAPVHGDYRSRLGIAADAVVVLYSGSLGGKQGLQLIPAAAGLLAGRKDIVFVVCGDGVMKPVLEAAAASLPNLRLLPLQPAGCVKDLLRMADIHLLPQNPGASDLVLPSKLAGMLASGRPVIATCHEDTELSAVVSIGGIVVPPDDCPAFAAAICKMADDSAARAALGEQGRRFAEVNFDKELILNRMFATLEGVGSAVAAADATDTGSEQ